MDMFIKILAGPESCQFYLVWGIILKRHHERLTLTWGKHTWWVYGCRSLIILACSCKPHETSNSCPQACHKGHLQYTGSYANVSEISENLQSLHFKNGSIGRFVWILSNDFLRDRETTWPQTGGIRLDDLCRLLGTFKTPRLYWEMNHVRQASLQPRIWATGLKNFDSTNANRSDLFFFFSQGISHLLTVIFLKLINSGTQTNTDYIRLLEYLGPIPHSQTIKGWIFVPFFWRGELSVFTIHC